MGMCLATCCAAPLLLCGVGGGHASSTRCAKRREQDRENGIETSKFYSISGLVILYLALAAYGVNWYLEQARACSLLIPPCKQEGT